MKQNYAFIYLLKLIITISTYIGIRPINIANRQMKKNVLSGIDLIVYLGSLRERPSNTSADGLAIRQVVITSLTHHSRLARI